jgi:hypothetical protein
VTQPSRPPTATATATPPNNSGPGIATATFTSSQATPVSTGVAIQTITPQPTAQPTVAASPTPASTVVAGPTSTPATGPVPTPPPAMTTTPPAGLGYDVERVLAPIDTIALVAGQVTPGQYTLDIVSGLPSGCARFDHIDLTQTADTIRVDVWNWMPTASSGAICTAIFGTKQNSIPLEPLVSGQSYAVTVNGQTTTFMAQ